MCLTRVGIVILSLAAFLSPANPQSNPSDAAPGPSSSRGQPFTDELRKTIAFLRVGFVKDGRIWNIEGTAFFVLYPDQRFGKDGGFTYLVTNRHMAEPGSEEGRKYPVQYVSTRLNVNSQPPAADGSTSRELAITFSPWAFPTDPAVDLAVTLVAPMNFSADYKAVPISMFATKEIMRSQNVTGGDQVFFAGYFYQFPGNKRIQPIVRQGVLAMVPDEQMLTTLQRPGNVYLADIHAFHGNSGSPIFVNAGGIHGGNFGPPAYLLLGVVSGYYPESETNFSLPAARVLTGEVHDNSGITVIVPADEIRVLLETPALKEEREAIFKLFKNH